MGPREKKKGTLLKTNKTLKNNAWIRSHTFLLAQNCIFLWGSLAGFLLDLLDSITLRSTFTMVKVKVNCGVVVGEVDIFEMRVFLWNSENFQCISLQEVLKPDEISRKPSKPIRYTMRSFWVQASPWGTRGTGSTEEIGSLIPWTCWNPFRIKSPVQAG